MISSNDSFESFLRMKNTFFRTSNLSFEGKYIFFEEKQFPFILFYLITSKKSFEGLHKTARHRDGSRP